MNCPLFHWPLWYLAENFQESPPVNLGGSQGGDRRYYTRVLINYKLQPECWKLSYGPAAPTTQQLARLRGANSSDMDAALPLVHLSMGPPSASWDCQRGHILYVTLKWVSSIGRPASLVDERELMRPLPIGRNYNKMSCSLNWTHHSYLRGGTAVPFILPWKFYSFYTYYGEFCKGLACMRMHGIDT